MIANLEPQAPPEPPKPAKRSPNLILHCGASHVPFHQVQDVETPAPTDSWCPIPHHQLIQTVQKTLRTNSLTIGKEAHSLTHDGQRYFGLMEIKTRSSDADYCWVLGLRNSHDKMFPAGLVAGSAVFICDNLAFAGEIKFARKHTRFINRDLPQLVERSIGRLMDKWHHQDKRIEAYKNQRIEDGQAHDLIIRATDVGVCANRLIPKVLSEWREPKHAPFVDRNVWSLFNSFTEALKGGPLQDLPKKTEALHGLLDSWVGLN